jgi:hypothetical protein
MSLLSVALAVALALVFVNAILQLLLAVQWNRTDRPGQPLLKPATLCTTVARVRTVALSSARNIRGLLAQPIRRNLVDRGRNIEQTAQEEV